MGCREKSHVVVPSLQVAEYQMRCGKSEGRMKMENQNEGNGECVKPFDFFAQDKKGLQKIWRIQIIFASLRKGKKMTS